MNLRRSRRRDLALANANAAIWAVGNGLVSTMLVIYLALELGAPATAIGLILAAPRFAGVLRLATPAMLARLRQRKLQCIALLAASNLVLLTMPGLAAPESWTTSAASGESPLAGVVVLVVCWCLYHLLEYLGVVLLWSWLADVMPPRLRGRLIGQRESCLLVGRLVGMGLSFALVGFWGQLAPQAARWEPLGWSAMIGSVVMLLSVAPLMLMSRREPTFSALGPSPRRAIMAAFTDRRFRRLLVFSCCFAVANGITQAAQSVYHQRVLNVRYEVMLGLRGMMHGGQAFLAPWAGAWLDRRGARTMLIVSQLIVATGPLFYFLATPQQWWWLAGAYGVWIAYGAMNVGLDHLKLSLAPPQCTTAALSVYYSLSDLANGVMAVAGGMLYDYLTAGGPDAQQLYPVLFLAGWLARTAVSLLLWRIDESPRR